jgi:hypothetical protein
MRSKMRKQLAAKLTVEDSDMPVVWATTHQPLRLSDGWKRDQKMHDGCIYTHPKYGLGSLRGIEDDAGRKWMHFSLMPTCPITLEDVRDFRRAFFPDRAIVSLAIEPGTAKMLNMWWAVDEKGVPMDPDWKAVMTPEADDG